MKRKKKTEKKDTVKKKTKKKEFIFPDWDSSMSGTYFPVSRKNGCRSSYGKM